MTSTVSTLGFPNEIVDLDVNPITSVTLASDESTQVVVRVTVPATASTGSQDVMTLTARDSSAPAVRASARGTTATMWRCSSRRKCSEGEPQPNSGMPCRGCYGPMPNVVDQGAKIVSAVASIIDSKEPEEIEKIRD